MLGGDAAALNRFHLVHRDGSEESPPMASKWVGVRLSRGERVRLETPGGGGYGPVTERDTGAIARDLEAGYITPDAARTTYGFKGAA